MQNTYFVYISNVRLKTGKDLWITKEHSNIDHPWELNTPRWRQEKLSRIHSHSTFLMKILCFFKDIHILLLFIIDIKEQQNDPQQEQTKYDDAQ